MTVFIDGIRVQAQPGDTILDACSHAGVEVPTLCHEPSLSPRPSCFVCVVRLEDRERLVPACGTQVEEGMVVDASSQEVRGARRAILELLLSDHAGDCIAPCQTVCPAGVPIPKALEHIARGEFEAAFRVFYDATGLPGVLGRLCHAPCEQGCRRRQADGGLGIRALERFAAHRGSTQAVRTREDIEGKVAIVGSGASGLAAAHRLLQLGHAVVLFERERKPGGRLAMEHPETLEPRVLSEDLERLLGHGLRLVCGVSVEGPTAMDGLLSQYDAVILASGAGSLPLFPDLVRGPKGLLVSRNQGSTNLPRVFAAGSITDPGLPLVRRIASGQLAASGAHRAITGRSESSSAFSVHVGRMPSESLRQYVMAASSHQRNSKADGSFELLTAEEARTEALRCLRCSCSASSECKLRRYAIAYGAEPNQFDGVRRAPSIDDTHPELVFEPGKCISCGICVRIAELDRRGSGLAPIGRGFDLRIGPPLGCSLADALGGTARRCAEACPTSALHLRVWPKKREKG